MDDLGSVHPSAKAEDPITTVYTNQWSSEDLGNLHGLVTADVIIPVNAQGLSSDSSAYRHEELRDPIYIEVEKIGDKMQRWQSGEVMSESSVGDYSYIKGAQHESNRTRPKGGQEHIDLIRMSKCKLVGYFPIGPISGGWELPIRFTPNATVTLPDQTVTYRGKLPFSHDNNPEQVYQESNTLLGVLPFPAVVAQHYGEFGGQLDYWSLLRSEQIKLPAALTSFYQAEVEEERREAQCTNIHYVDHDGEYDFDDMLPLLLRPKVVQGGLVDFTDLSLYTTKAVRDPGTGRLQAGQEAGANNPVYRGTILNARVDGIEGQPEENAYAGPGFSVHMNFYGYEGIPSLSGFGFVIGLDDQIYIDLRRGDIVQYKLFARRGHILRRAVFAFRREQEHKPKDMTATFNHVNLPAVASHPHTATYTWASYPSPPF